MGSMTDKLQGSAKELAGKMTGNDELEAKGKAQQVVGNLKDRAEDMKEAAGKKLNGVLDDAKTKTDDDQPHQSM